jgi:hypothetical protein
VPNLILTNACNLRCPFCFATESRVDRQSAAVTRVGRDEFGRWLAWLGSDRVKFCGGEPTLHPDFIEFLEMAFASASPEIVVMTNGLWPEAVRRHIARLPPRKQVRVSFLFNVLEPSLYRKVQEQRLAASLAAVNPHATSLGFTIYKRPFDCSHVLELAQRTGIRHLRYSIAAPNISDPASWAIVPERDFRPLARTVVRLAERGRRAGLSLGGDCGYLPRCVYTPGDLDRIQANPGAMQQCRLSPVDLAPGGAAWRCYGLYSVLRTTVDWTEPPGRLDAYFDRRVRLLEDLLLFERCRDCVHLETRQCLGGCYALRVARQLRRDPATCLFPVDDDEQLLRCEPVFIGHLAGVFRLAPQKFRVFLQPGRMTGRTCMELQVNAGTVRLLQQEAPGRTLREWAPELAGPFAAASDPTRAALALVRSLFDQDLLTFRRRGR